MSKAAPAPAKKTDLSQRASTRKTHPIRIEGWFNEKENSLIEKAAQIKGRTRKEYMELLVLTASEQIVTNAKKKK